MSGMGYIITGGVILVGATAVFLVTEWVLQKKKKQIREQTYQIYE